MIDFKDYYNELKQMKQTRKINSSAYTEKNQQRKTISIEFTDKITSFDEKNRILKVIVY